MDVGLAISVFDIDGGTAAIAGELARAGAAADEAGATSLSLMDHYFQIEATGRPAESQMLEGYTTPWAQPVLAFDLVESVGQDAPCARC
jgi:hypothetical protein